MGDGLGSTHGTGYVAHITSDFCEATSKECVKYSVHEKGPEEEHNTSRSTEWSVFDTPVEEKGSSKLARVNADSPSGSTHNTSGTLEDTHILSPVTVCALGRRVYWAEEATPVNWTTWFVHKHSGAC